jgi:uncharacterized protein (TIGR03084 family)
VERSLIVGRIDELCADLTAERHDLQALLDGRDPADWQRPTPAEPWTVLDQVVHLAWFDDAARLAIVDPDEFVAQRRQALADVDGFVETVRTQHTGMAAAEVADWLAAATAALTRASAEADPSRRVPWYGPDMTIASCLTARIMETWAHGQDVADALGVTRPPSDRLRHVAFLGVRAMPNSFRAHGLAVPEASVRVELVGPDGARWAFGAEADDATDVVRGTALDFCLLVTQRVHRDDTALIAEGPVADRWLDVAQAFAGPPGAKRPAGARTPRLAPAAGGDAS